MDMHNIRLKLCNVAFCLHLSKMNQDFNGNCVCIYLSIPTPYLLCDYCYPGDNFLCSLQRLARLLDSRLYRDLSCKI